MPKTNLFKPNSQIASEKLIKWIRRQEKQKVIAAGIGISENRFSYKCNHNAFEVEELMKIFHFLETDPEEIGKLLTY